MRNFLFYSILFTCLAITSLSGHVVKRSINWNGNNWAFGCDFKGKDLRNARIRGEDCSGRCAHTSGRTHFTWTTWNSGTCWMKYGGASKYDAFPTYTRSMVCGVIDYSSENPKIDTGLNGVLATRHGATENGTCELPASNYAVINPVALGSIASLNHLKFRPELCGQILDVNCGYGSLDIIITNSNYGGGLDLYGSTWDKLTNNKPPGETYCSVELNTGNPFNFNRPVCFYKPDSPFDQAYYKNIGLLNTNGRLVTQATIDGRLGAHRGDNPFYAFDFGPINDDKQVIFTSSDGTTHSVFLRDSQKENNK